MRTRVLLAALAAVLAACGEKPAPAPAAPSPQAVGAELATFRQVLVPVSPVSADGYNRAVAQRGEGNVTDEHFKIVYGRGVTEVAGSTITVFAAYGGAWLMPSETVARPMGALQFLRAFEDAGDCAGAVVVAPKGRLYVPREQLLDVIIAARAAGAPDGKLPFSLVRGAAR